MIMGNLNKNSIKEIWNNDEYKKLRKLHEDGEWYKHPICPSCEVPLIELYKELVKRGIPIDTKSSINKSKAIVDP